MENYMPQAANLVVNNAAAVAKTFTLMVTSAGDDSLCTFALKEGASPSVYPTFTCLTRKSGNRSRKVQVKLVVPDAYVESTTGLGKVNSKVEFNLDVTVPDDFPDSKRADAAAYWGNLMGHALVRAMNQDALPMV